ncbi:hypothetical protein JOW58_25305, partial [Escherichia coli]|nr:hypothetical protein [Escherichia coli]
MFLAKVIGDFGLSPLLAFPLVLIVLALALVQAGLRGNGPDEKSLFVKLTNTISVLLAI